MFREIISQLSFSPATVERLSAYANTVRKKQRISGWSLIVLSVLLIIQVIITVAPPHTPQLVTQNDLIPGGVTSAATLLSAYDENINGFKDAAMLFSIDRQNLASATRRTAAPSLPYGTGITPRATGDEHAYSLPSHILYVRDANTHQATQDGWLGETASGQPFYIIAQDGNILSSGLPLTPSMESVFSLSHIVAQQNSDKIITWKLTATNTSSALAQEDISFSTADIEEYASIEAPTGAIVSSEEQVIIWPGVALNPQESKTLIVTARLHPKIETTGRNLVNTYSYDCRISTAFGNTQETPVPCPIIKQLELLAYDLPLLAGTTNILIFASLLLINAATYLTLRQLTKEIRIIRTQLNTGGL